MTLFVHPTFNQENLPVIRGSALSENHKQLWVLFYIVIRSYFSTYAAVYFTRPRFAACLSGRRNSKWALLRQAGIDN